LAVPSLEGVKFGRGEGIDHMMRVLDLIRGDPELFTVLFVTPDLRPYAAAVQFTATAGGCWHALITWN